MTNWENEKENLRRMYIEDGLSQAEIAKRYNVSEGKVSKYIKLFNIFRSPEDILRLKIKKDPNIVRKCKYCGKIFYSSRKNENGKYRDYCCTKCNTLDNKKISDDNILIKQLEENNWNYSKVGRLNGVSDKAIENRMRKIGIYKRRKHDWSDIVDLESAQKKIDELGIRMAKELHKTYSGLSDKIKTLGLLSYIKYPGIRFDSLWEERMFNLIQDNISYTSLDHNIILDPECKHINPLVFDIVIEYPSSVKVVIELQGPTHFKEVYGNNYKYKSFNDIRKRDEIKYQYCLSHNIDLYYFTYESNLLDKYGYPYYVYTSEDLLLLEKLKSY